MRRIPVWGRGNVVRAYALVDDADYEDLSQYRWYLNSNGYVRRHGGRKADGSGYYKVYMHQQVLGFPAVGVDHEDKNRLNCQRANLRLATKAQNAQNQGSRGGTSRYRGVSWSKACQKWEARITLDGKQYYCGVHVSEEAAAEAAAAFRAEHMPFSGDAARIRTG